MNKSQTFSKQQRIYKKKEIQELFDKGSSFYLYPFSIKITKSDSLEQNSVLVSVSKRFFKKAVDRNFLKRRIKEAYRLNQQLYDNKGFKIAFLYNSQKKHDFSFLESRIIKILEKLGSEFVN